MNIEVFQKEENYKNKALEIIQSVYKPQINIALSGGITPIPVYRALKESEVDLSQINFYQVDERYVPNFYSDSNFKMIKETLELKASDNNFYFFNTDLELNDCVKDYEEKLKNLKDFSFDLVVLGIGNDGHFASIFPESAAIFTDSFVKITETKIFNVRNRLTITAKLILRTKKILILLKGEEKSAVLEEIKNPTKSEVEFPIHLLKSHSDVDLLYYQY